LAIAANYSAYLIPGTVILFLLYSEYGPSNCIIAQRIEIERGGVNIDGKEKGICETTKTPLPYWWRRRSELSTLGSEINGFLDLKK
jgi:hypothetical protein